MKIAIIGKNSYIGRHIKEWFEQKHENEVYEVDSHDGKWKAFDFRSVDAVIHVAGIVHRPDVTDWDLYKRVNIDLPVEIATVAKQQGVKQLVFLSTMGVFGVDKKLSKNVIDKSNYPNPNSMYGESKYQAETQLKELEDENFTITIVRPPNVYGKDCKGGYITGFASVVRKLPFIPCVYENVKQSVIYIDNLTEFIYLLVLKRMSGVFMPQDIASVSAVELMDYISKALGLKRWKSRLFGIFAYLLAWTPIAKKAYGGIEYDIKLSEVSGIKYQIVSTEEGIRRTLM